MDYYQIVVFFKKNFLLIQQISLPLGSHVGSVFDWLPTQPALNIDQCTSPNNIIHCKIQNFGEQAPQLEFGEEEEWWGGFWHH